MKLVQKLTFALVIGMSAMLTGNGYLRVKREVAAFQADRVRDHDLIGRSLGAAVAAVWRTDGEAQALAIVDASNARSGNVHVRWISLDATGAVDPRAHGQGALRIDSAAFGAIADGETLTRIDRDAAGDELRFTYVPVAIDGTRRGALELSESLTAERRYVRTTIQDTALTTLALALVSAGLSIILGVWLVGRPVRALAEKARRIGSGDFSDPVKLEQKDELALLAGEMNAMCDRLVEANERVAQETAARIATLEQLRHTDRLMTVGKLSSGIAHELGTPLNVVSARAQMIARAEVTGDEAAAYARIVVDASERMAKIIRQLLTFARRKGSQKAEHDLRRLVKETLELLRTLAAKKDVALVLREAADLPPVVHVDAGQLQQAIINLVVNAIQAMTAPGDVTVALARARAKPPEDVGGPEAEYLCLAVIDTGAGVPKEMLAHVFEPFFTTKDVGEGTGLGLSVAYGIVHEHGGFIGVESVEGRGATFSIYIPVA